VLRLNPSFFWLRRGAVGVFSSDEGIEVCYQQQMPAPAAAPSARGRRPAPPPFPSRQQQEAALDAEIEAAVISSTELDPPL
jgi:hypothetical protein